MPRDLRRLIFASILCALMVPAVALIVYKLGPAIRLDVSVFRHFVEPEGSRDFGLADDLTRLANPLPFVAIVAGLVALGLGARRFRETAVALAIVVGANVSTQIFKHLLEHPRWDLSLGMLQPSPEAFPSGHTTAAASFAVALVLIAPPRLRPLAAGVGAACTAAVGIGVVVIGAHYPSDVLGGLLVVGAWGFAGVAALRLWQSRGQDAPGLSKEGSRSGPFATSLR